MSRKKAAKAENHERWLITYADLITLLLVFFIVLYAGSQDDSKKFAILAHGLRSAFHNVAWEGAGGSSAVFLGTGTTTGVSGSAQELQDFKRLETVFQQFAEQNGLAGQITLRTDSDGIAVVLTGDLLFPPGDAQVRPSALPTLETLARTLLDLPNNIRVEGHTDNVPANTPAYPSNWELSTGRATAIVRWLVDQGHLPASRLFAAGYADTHPLADNATADGRRENRRAEVVILYPANGAGTPTPEAGR